MHNRKNLKNVFLSFVAFFAIYFSYWVLAMKPLAEPNNCEHYTSLFQGGGVKTYEDKDYLVKICGYGASSWDSVEKIRIQVFNNQDHELLATRFFTLGLGGGEGYYPVLVSAEKNNISYFKNGNEEFISMPPTWWDWIYARLP